jgi:hypothetical protein
MSEHGELRPLGADDMAGECDWGECSRPAAYLRLDMHGHGWLPCCEACAKKPPCPYTCWSAD